MSDIDNRAAVFDDSLDALKYVSPVGLSTFNHLRSGRVGTNCHTVVWICTEVDHSIFDFTSRELENSCVFRSPLLGRTLVLVHVR